MLWIILAAIFGWPILALFCAALSIVGCAIRDTLKYLKVPLKEGYSRLHWLYLVPMIFGSMIATQVKSWWNGYSTVVDIEGIE